MQSKPSEEISELKSQQRELSCELAKLQKKQNKSIVYSKKGQVKGSVLDQVLHRVQ